MEIKAKKPVTWVEAKKILEEKAKEKEIGYHQKIALDFLRKFTKIKEKDAKELDAELEKIGKLSSEERVKIINLMPETEDELKIILEDSFSSLSEEERKAIIKVVKAFLK
ncbi:MAG: RNA polymerase Rpb4 [Candidatus Aenigmatarchaeota archaeon]